MNRALLVGINKYPPQYSSLEGCVNDVTDMASFLVAHCGFAMDDVHLVCDTRATTAYIKDRLTWLVTGVAAGDRILFHFSGHGSQYAERDNQGITTEVHDCICPYDFAFDPAFMLTDADFSTIFAPVPNGALFDWISDSCHSGDLTKSIVQAEHPRYIAPPADIQWRIDASKAKRLAMKDIPSASATLNVALIAGCTSVQESMDAVFNNRHNGALTYFLLSALSGANGLTTPLSTLIPSVTAQIESSGYDQTPQLHGSAALTSQPFLN